MDGHGLGCSGGARPHMVDFKAGKHRDGTKLRTTSVFMCPASRFFFFNLHDERDMKTSLNAQGVHGNSCVKVPKFPFSTS